LVIYDTLDISNSYYTPEIGNKFRRAYEKYRDNTKSVSIVN